MLLSFMDTVFQKFSCTGLVKTGVGIKLINQIVTSNYFNDIIVEVKTNLEFQQLLAGPDFLKDEYTLIGRNISEWPHYELIKCLDKDLPVNNCSYIKKRQNGTLDSRKKQKVSIEKLENIYQEKLDAMEKGKIFGIKVFTPYDNIYTVADGRHSLAMAFYFNYRNLRFDIIQNLTFDTYFRWIFKKIESDKDFTKHNEFFRKVYGYRKRRINTIIEKKFDR